MAGGSVRTEWELAGVLGEALLPVPGCAAIRVRPPGDLGYWSVRDGAYELVPAADTYLRFLRYGRGRALGTTEKYAGNLAVFFDWCARCRLDLVQAAGRFDEFVLLLRNQLVTRPGRGVGRPRAGRINHILVSVREMYRSALAHGVVGEDAIAALFVMGEVPDLGVLGASGRGGSRCVRVTCCGPRSRARSCRSRARSSTR